MKKIFNLLLIASCVFTLASCSSDDDDTTVELKLDKTTVEVKAGESVTIAIEAGNGDYAVSSNSSAETASAEVSGSTISVKGLKEGETTLGIKDKAGKSASVKVTVKAADYVPTSAEFSWNGNKVELDKANNWGTSIFASQVAVTNLATKEQSVLSWTGGLTVGDKTGGKLEVAGSNAATITLSSIKVVKAESNTYYITFEGDSKKGWIYFTK